jgi:hypothetical protein
MEVRLNKPSFSTIVTMSEISPATRLHHSGLPKSLDWKENQRPCHFTVLLRTWKLLKIWWRLVYYFILCTVKNLCIFFFSLSNLT